MFDIWIGDMNLTALVIVFSVLIVFPLQLLLCYRAKTLLIRLIPAALILLFALVSLILLLAAPGWDGLGYIFFLIYAGGMLFFCGLAWLLRAILTHLKAKKQ